MTGKTFLGLDVDPDVAAGVRHWLIKGYAGVVITAVILFVPAGRWDWWNGWAYVALWLLWQTAMAVILIPTSPELLAERAKRQKGDKPWDAALISVYGVITLAYGIVAGLDVRFGWTAGADGINPIPLWLQIAGWVVTALGFALAVWSMRANAYFSTVVRIQDDRGHAVASGGPYRYVRHPGYSGQLLVNLGTPLLLGSLWTVILAVLAIALFVARTALEDKTLHEELPGYAEYAQRTPYRLLPGIW
jgi:protein-S-isoprenylcysteine O-methyltransferase Ste14